ncbi:MAG: hypothetical protein R6V01_03005 [Thermoplasmatota archaeon]
MGVRRSHSFACNMAALSERSARNNSERHEMLVNDTLPRRPPYTIGIKSRVRYRAI